MTAHYISIIIVFNKKSKEKIKMLIFETHFHYNESWNAKEYVRESSENGVVFMLAVAADRESCDISANLAKKFENIFYSIGIHPHDAKQTFDFKDDFRYLAQASGKCVAIGEIGLDYFYENSDRMIQMRSFEFFLELALDLKLPVIVHCRDRNEVFSAYEDSYSILKTFADAGGEFVVHCFTGNTAFAKKFLDLGAFIGVTGIATFPKAENVREIIRYVPLDKILLETDAPYLAPKPFRGKENHSKYLPFIAQAVADEKKSSIEMVCSKTLDNAFALFANAKKYRDNIER